MPTKKILFADDNRDDQGFMLEAAARAGLEKEFIVVSDGDEAIAYLDKVAGGKGDAPKLAILDLSMPRVTGLETLEWIRKSPLWCSLPVFILTASSKESDIRAAYLRGANGFMIKPTTIQDLFELVQGLKGFWLRFVIAAPGEGRSRG